MTGRVMIIDILVVHNKWIFVLLRPSRLECKRRTFVDSGDVGSRCWSWWR